MKKGFTLIELLAVLVILSVIALISIPIVSNVLESGRVSAIENSTEFYIKEIEKAYAEWSIEGYPEGINVTTNNGYDVFTVEQLNDILKLQGTKPLNGAVSIDNNYASGNSNYGFVVTATLTYDGGYIVTYTYDKNRSDNKKKNIKIEKE